MRSETGAPPTRKPDADPRILAQTIERQINYARVALFVEQVLPVLTPLLGIMAAFVGLSWIGFWREVPTWVHVPVLTLFAIGLIWSLWILRTVRWPDRERGRRRVEIASGLANRPLAALDDSLASGTKRLATRALWEAHRRQATRHLGSLRFKWPEPLIRLTDGYAFRLLAVMILYVGAFVGYGSYGSRIADAFHFGQPIAETALRIDAWVTPPSYTGYPPIFLNLDRGGQAVSVVSDETDQTKDVDDKVEAIRIPYGSLATIRAQGLQGMQVAYASGNGERVIAAVPDELEAIPASTKPVEPANSVFSTHQIKLDKDGAIVLRTEEGDVARWKFEVVQDALPEISMREPPEIQQSGAVKLTYSMKDDYGIIGARARITPKEESITFAAESSEVRPLITAPKFKLALPQRRTKSGSSQTFRDLTSHPWAGSLVSLDLQARDEAGQTGESEALEFRLPARNFSKPMARAIVEQRRNLALDANRRLQVLDAFDALMIAPERFIDDASIYLGMRYVFRRLQEAEADKDLVEALDVMWDLALAIEDGDLSLAERALREAEEALRRALENGASEEEIKRLTQDLRDAMDEYFKALAEQMMRNPGQISPQDPNAQTLRQQDLEEMLNQIEDLARTGAHDAAREMLSQMQQMLENLRAGRPQMQQGNSANEMSEALKKLGEMIQKQRELMDQSFQMDQEERRQRRQQRQNRQNQQGQRDGQKPDGQQRPGGQPGEGSQQDLAQQLAEALRQLQQGQGDLQKSLEQLLQQLERDGIRSNEALKDAGRAMGKAEGALGQGEPGNAVGPQGDALQALQQGTKGLIEQMMNQGQGQGMADGRGDQRNTDPMGRPYRNVGPDDGEAVKVPGEIDTQRARSILRQLRKKLGDPLRSDTERNYFERLLTPY